jgi:leucyl-tRNA synthetase
MIFTNYLLTLEKLDKSILHHFLLLLNPFAPHLSEELNQILEFEEISKADWPIYDASKIIDETIDIAVQINGKTRGSISIFIDADQDTVEQTVKDNEKINKYLTETNILNIIYIKGRIINFVVE